MEINATPRLFTDTILLRIAGFLAGSGRLHLGLRDDRGIALKKLTLPDSADGRLPESYCWDGLQDIPYGRYHLSYQCEEAAGSIALVKRI